MTLADTAPVAEPRTSLRERKKLATRRSLRRHALDLVAQRGFMHVTVEDRRASTARYRTSRARSEPSDSSQAAKCAWPKR